ncbi:uncharacterized protein PHACADRAFT_180769 [Phanerochaete carnosa HHB-10118-sp]|uniref:F-box domain-containing protein n=1 Tax=Phanerochaete carnosa (strain HHB-10118-sp) TaxID=650164 RepID=K5WQC0_PHACS|nr:uncharacterized protein PHACADRAFT_180769 [Phanerochaete carnosa HHB-10118-sp]EKM61675.1 hypothetical protein PHACADRAFT_180769 [Phanerochaete carnosa HHB-10118-sp]
MPCKVLRNRTSISSLPAEILEWIIYVLAAQVLGPDLWPDNGQEYARILLQITHVCRCWKHVAHASQRLWVNVFIGKQHPEFIELALKLSGTSLLDVRAIDSIDQSPNDASRHANQLASLLTEHMHRIRVLIVYPAIDEAMKKHTFPTNLDAPELRCLHLYKALSFERPAWLSLRCPNLEDLHVVGATDFATWHTIERNLCLPTLQRLEINPYSRSAETTRIPTLQDILKMLRRLPHLESLSVTVPSWVVWPDLQEEVSLPKLQDLMIFYTHPDDSNHSKLLQSLIIPYNTHLEVGWSTFQIPAGRRVPSMMHAQDLIFQSTLPTTLLAFGIIFRPHGYITMHGRTFVGQTMRDDGTGDSHDFLLETASPATVRWFGDHLPLDRVLALRLSGVRYCGDDESVLQEVYRVCEKLKNVMEIHFFSEFRQVHIERFVASMSPENGLMFPKLKALYFEKSFRLEDTSAEDGEREELHSSIRLRHTLVSAIAQRHSHGHISGTTVVWKGSVIHSSSHVEG